MKRFKSIGLLLGLLGCAMLSSCGGPKVIIRYARAPEIAIPDAIKSIAIVELGGQRAADRAYGEIAAAQLQDMLSRSPRFELVERSRLRGILMEQDLADAGITSATGAAKAGKVANVDAVIFGTVHVVVNDIRGTRQESYIDSYGNQRYRTIPTLVRNVSASVNVAMVDTTTARVYATRSETTNFSSSRNRLPGKRSWAEAFARKDDPTKVPPADQIINYLLGRGVEKFFMAVCPHYIVYEVQLSGVDSDPGKLANDYAKAGNFIEATKLFAEAVAVNPEDDGAVFNLGVMKEMAGDLHAALKLYQQALKMKGKSDDKYMQAEVRVRREIQVKQR
ncbi:MAG: CsgG/HfaB family protein [Planctomycetia bacterium]|nr:CsgG/HfaB family protein [Planctomycetia bacterium]